jgi:phthalate 4,5-cis-dihydrodiol dehydrogenase
MLRNPRVAVVAAADVRAVALEKLRADIPVTAHDSVGTLCADPSVEAVYIATPTVLHTEHVLTAIRHGKHVLVEKPMAVTLDDAQRMIDAAEQRGVALMVGHSQSFEPPIRKIREIVRSGELGRVRLMNGWYFTDWLYRPRLPEELDTSLGGGVIFRQGAHHFDILRLIGGGLARSVRAVTGAWDPQRPGIGSYSAFITFEDGAVATAVYSGYDHFRTTELTFSIGEGGQEVGNEVYASARAALRDSTGGERERKAAVAFGGTQTRQAAPRGERRQSFFGLTLVSCERGDIRQSPDGLLIYGDEQRREVPLPRGTNGRDVMVEEFYRAVVHGLPPINTGRWAKATLEVSHAVVTSAAQQREVALTQQVAVPD